MRRAKSASSLTGGPGRIEMPGPERKGLGKQVRWGGREGRGKSRLHRPGLGADTFPAFTSGRAQGLGPGSEGAKFDLGFCGLGDAL